MFVSFGVLLARNPRKHCFVLLLGRCMQVWWVGCWKRAQDNLHNFVLGFGRKFFFFCHNFLGPCREHYMSWYAAKALLAKYVMKKSGSLRYCESEEVSNDASEGIDFLGARITRDADGTVWCDQSKYIQHCLRENGFLNQEGQVVLRKTHAPPSVDEKLGEEEGSVRELNIFKCSSFGGGRKFASICLFWRSLWLVVFLFLVGVVMMDGREVWTTTTQKTWKTWKRLSNQWKRTGKHQIIFRNVLLFCFCVLLRLNLTRSSFQLSFFSLFLFLHHHCHHHHHHHHHHHVIVIIYHYNFL